MDRGTLTVSVNVAGLSGSVVLQNNAGNDLTVNANGAFNFTTKLANAAAYEVTVKTQPNNQRCDAATNGKGTSSAGNVVVPPSTALPVPPSAATSR
jgi:hypothetical protein